jgi:acetyl esterase/lipase
MAEAPLRRLTTRVLLNLPAPVLRVLSGGASVEAGRVLDPRLQYLSRLSPRRPPHNLAEARRRAERLDAALHGKLEPEVAIETVQVPGPAGPLDARLYRPNGLRPEGVLVWLPSGGGVAPGLARDQAFCSILARLGRCVVVAVQPRLAPEHRLPAPLDDACAALRWARAEAAALGAPAGRVGIGGAGFGGGVAAAVCQALKRKGEPQPTLQLLLAPWVDAASETQSMILFADAWPLTAAELSWRIDQLLAPGTDPADPRVSPIKAEDLSGLAPAVVVTAGFDPLVDQAEAYAKRLTDAGVPVLYRCYDRLTHDFQVMTGLAACADLACREIAGLLREGLQRRVELVEA